MIYKLSRFLFEIFFKILLKVTVSGRENIPDSPYIIVANHASLADPPLIGTAFKKPLINFMAKKELFDIPVVGAWMRAIKAIEVDRDSPVSSSIKEAVRRIAKGEVVAVFPEGTRSIDGNIGEAKRGIGFIVAKSKVPVLPVYIRGSNIAFPKGGRIKVGTSVDIIIGKAIMPREFFQGDISQTKTYDEITSLVMERIAGLRKNT